jgi:hypothetical protein
VKNPKCPKCGGKLRPNGHTPGGKQRWICRANSGERQACYSTTNPNAGGVRKQDGTVRRKKTPIFKRTRGKANVFVVTCAQNATPKHEGFYKTLESYCEKRSAELLVIPTRYKNPTSRWTESQANADWWDVPAAQLLNTRFRINKNLQVIADVKTQPTAIQPLTGFEALTAGESAILGHTKLEFRTIATPQGRLPKILTTTGACTVPNYTDSKTGALGAFHHTLGAAVVEAKDGKFHIRQLLGDKRDGSFYDLDNFYVPGGRHSTGVPILSLAMGDTHRRAICKAVEKATFGEIIPALKPQHIIWHDLSDGYTVNPHAYGNPFIPIERDALNENNVEMELWDDLQYVAKHTPKWATSVIVPSNHNDFLHRWINDNDWRRLDPGNKVFYLQTALALAKMARDGKGFDAERLNAFIYWAKQHFAGSKNIKVLEYDESYMLGSIEHGMHGHRGPNGARGNPKNLRRIGVKTNTGHIHSPGIQEGNYSAGTSTPLRVGYNTGPSSWLNTHIATYANSKRTLLNIIDGEWRLA